MPPNVAQIPVYSTKLPYCVPYSPNSPTFPDFINVSLTGPEITFPSPRPSERNEYIIGPSIWPVRRCTVLRMPGQVLVNEPAKRPYMKEKVSSGAREVLNPQIRK